MIFNTVLFENVRVEMFITFLLFYIIGFGLVSILFKIEMRHIILN